MKIEVAETEVEAGEDIQSYEFSVDKDNQGLIFDILRSKIYENPIGSICREISCNSRDANRENGKATEPIDISFTQSLTEEKYEIRFSDHGIGISPDRMKEIFVNYGSSTKRDSNKYTGGFGLGSKTPFSYTENFFIETTFDGTKYIYSAIVEKNQAGSVFLMESQKCEDASGTTIIIPIKKSDINTFQKECQIYTSLWDVQPNFHNFSSSRKVEVLYKDHSFMITKCKDWNYSEGFDGIYALIDGIPYKIKNGTLGEDSSYHYNSNQTAIFINIRVGEISVSANRESLHLDENTVNILKRRAKVILHKMKEVIDEDLKNIECLFDAKIYCHDITYGISTRRQFLAFIRAFEKDYKLLFENQEIKTIIQYNGFEFFLKNKDGKAKRPFEHFGHEFKENQIYFMDSGCGKAREATIFADKNSYIQMEFDRWDEIKNFSNLSFHERKENALIMRNYLNTVEQMKKDGLEYYLFSSVGRTKLEKVARIPLDKDKTQITYFDPSYNNDSSYTRHGRHRRYGNVNLTGTVGDLKDCIVLLTEENPKNTSPNEVNGIKNLKGKIPNGKRVIFVNSRSKRHFPEATTYAEFIKSFDQAIFQDFADYRYFSNHCNRSFVEILEIDSFKEYKKYISTLKQFDGNLPEGIEPSDKIKEICKFVNNLINKYPLLKFVRCESYNSEYNEYKKEVNGFINKMESTDEVY